MILPFARPISLIARSSPLASRGLCRLMLRNQNGAGPQPPPSEQDAFDALREMSTRPPPSEEITSEAALAELKKAARRADEERRGFEDGMLNRNVAAQTPTQTEKL